MANPAELPALRAVGESALLVEPLANEVAVGLGRTLRTAPPHGVVAIVPAAQSLLIRFDPLTLGRSELEAIVIAMLAVPPSGELARRTVTIEAAFGGDDGPDLVEVAERLGLTEERLLAEICGMSHRVMMVGFAPGFPYLGMLPAHLHIPRRATPRAAVAAGSVAIAAGMLGIYPARLPGGWHLIGRTTALLFDIHRDPPSLVEAGDWVRFSAT